MALATLRGVRPLRRMFGELSVLGIERSCELVPDGVFGLQVVEFEERPGEVHVAKRVASLFIFLGADLARAWAGMRKLSKLSRGVKFRMFSIPNS